MTFLDIVVVVIFVDYMYLEKMPGVENVRVVTFDTFDQSDEET